MQQEVVFALNEYGSSDIVGSLTRKLIEENTRNHLRIIL